MARARNRTYQRNQSETNQVLAAFDRIKEPAPSPSEQVGAPQGPAYNIFRRLISPDKNAQLDLLINFGAVFLEFPELHSARLRKAGDIMIPMLGNLQLRMVAKNGNAGAGLRALLEDVRARAAAQTDEHMEAAVRGWGIYRAPDEPNPRLLTDLRSSGVRHNRTIVSATLEELTGIDPVKKHRGNSRLPIGELPKGYPPLAKDKVKATGVAHLPNGSHLTFGSLEVIDLSKEAERYLTIGELAGLA